ncbi:Sucraseferredoxin-like protein, partial [Caulochytrium protostelioides]
SHYGGHKFAGNLIIFSTIDALNGVWYGRVTPECVQGIIEQTLLQGKVFQTLYRGRMN